MGLLRDNGERRFSRWTVHLCWEPGFEYRYDGFWKFWRHALQTLNSRPLHHVPFPDFVGYLVRPEEAFPRLLLAAATLNPCLSG